MALSLIFSKLLTAYSLSNADEKAIIEDRLLKISSSQAKKDSKKGYPSIEFLATLKLLDAHIEKSLRKLYFKSFKGSYSEEHETNSGPIVYSDEYVHNFNTVARARHLNIERI